MLTIIIPVYQVKPYLMQCMESVAAQSCTAFEAIVVDDGSSDGSEKLAQDFCRAHNDHFQYLRQENCGLSAARNCGMKAASGDYICFLDGDDRLVPTAVQRLQEWCCLYPLDCLFFNALKTNEQANAGELVHTSARIGGAVTTGREYLKQSLACKEWLPMAWCGVYSRTFLANAHITFDEGYIHEDEGFFCRCLWSAQHVMYADEVLYLYTIRKGSIMRQRNAFASCSGFLQALEVLSALPDIGLAEEVLWIMKRYAFSALKYYYQMPLEQQNLLHSRIDQAGRQLADRVKLTACEKMLFTQHAPNRDDREVSIRMWLAHVKGIRT